MCWVFCGWMRCRSGKDGTKDLAERGFGTGLGVWVCMVRVIGCLTVKISLGKEAFAVPGRGGAWKGGKAAGITHHPPIHLSHKQPVSRDDDGGDDGDDAGDDAGDVTHQHRANPRGRERLPHGVVTSPHLNPSRYGTTRYMRVHGTWRTY